MAPQGSKHEEDGCKCPIHSPSDWLVADLIGLIRSRDDVLDELIHAAKDVLIFRNSTPHHERLREALVALDQVERVPY